MKKIINAYLGGGEVFKRVCWALVFVVAIGSMLSAAFDTDYRAIVRKLGGIAEYDLNRCKPLPDYLQVDVKTIDDHTHSKGATRRVITLQGYSPNNGPYAIGYGTLDYYVKIGVKDHFPEISGGSDRIDINLTYHQPTIWEDDDYMGIRVFDVINCYNVDAAPFKQTNWIVVMTRQQHATLGSSILDKAPLFDDLPLYEALNAVEPATIITVRSWDAAQELLETGLVSAFVVDSRGNSDEQLMWNQVDARALTALYSTHGFSLAGVGSPTQDIDIASMLHPTDDAYAYQSVHTANNGSSYPYSTYPFYVLSQDYIQTRGDLVDVSHYEQFADKLMKPHRMSTTPQLSD